MSRTVTSRFVLKGDNQLKGAFGKAQQQLNRVAKAAGFATGALAGLFVRGVIRNTIEQENAIAQLNASLKSTGRYSEEASDALQDHAAALQKVTNYGDEAIIAAQSQLLTFKDLGGEALPKATEAVLDLATKMDGDLKGAVVLLGKALNDPATGLSYLTRVGITFSEEQKNVIRNLQETNRLADAQAIILNELQTEFGGSARAARDTLGGAFKAVKNNFGDLLEVTGDGKSGLVKSLNSLADTLASPRTQKAFQDTASAILSIANAMTAATTGTVNFAQWVGEQIAATVNGPAMDDVTRLDQEIDRLTLLINARNKGNRHQSDSWDQETKRLEILRETYRKWVKEYYDNPIPPPNARTGTAAANVANTVKPVGEAPGGPSENDLIALAKDEEQHLKDTAAALSELLKQRADSDAQVLEARNALEREYAGLIDQTRTESERFHDQLTTIDNLYTAGIIPSGEAYADLLDRINQQFEDGQEKAADAWDQMTQFAIQGARNMQTAFADFLIDPLSDGFKGLVKGFADMLKEMAAQAAASAIFNAIFGAMSNSSNSTIAAIGNALIKRDSGGSGVAGQPYLIGKGAQPELFVPKTAGTFIPNFDRMATAGGYQVNINIDAREQENPAKILSLIPIIQSQVEAGIAHKQRRGLL